MTNYLTAPATAKVYRSPGTSELILDAWLAIDYTMPPDLTWPDRGHLEMGPRGLFLTFEQGKNSPSAVFALKSQPEVDLADVPEFGLHYLPGDPEGSEFPAALRDFYRPVAELIDRLAGETGRPLLDRQIEVMTVLLDRIAEYGIVRIQDFDEDSGELVGMDRDIARDLPQAWRDKVAKEAQ
jgi:hypothetical protein